MKSKRKVIILIGPPGAGKGTQAELLADKLNLYYFETSKVLEEKFSQAKKNEFLNIEGKKYYVKNEKKLWLEGKLCSPPFVTFLVLEKIKQLFKEGKSLILAGSPRTLYEGKRIIPLLKKLYGKKNIKVILLNISAKETLKRNSQRRICRLMRHPILATRKEFLKLKYCPLDGSKLLKRKGLDDPETIKVRIKEYKERTYPLIDYFKKQGLSVIEISGSPPPAVVFKNILKTLKI
jgi:adenylate kinase